MKQSLVQALGQIQFRTMDQVRELFGGLEFVEPGLVPVPQWRPDSDDPVREGRQGPLGLACAGLARKP
jgi:hypothetical protein